MEKWELIIGITSLAMVAFSCVNLGALLTKQYHKNKETIDLFWIAWPTLIVNLIGVVVIMSVLIVNVY